MFWVNVPVGLYGTLWAYRKLRETGERHRARVDWWGNITFAVGLGAVLIAVTTGIQPYRDHTMGWTNPAVFGLLAGGLALLAAFAMIESGLPSRCSSSACSDPGLHRRQRGGIRRVHRSRRAAVHAHHLAAGDLAASARLQLQRHASVGRHLFAAPDRQLYRLGPHFRISL